MVNSVVSEHRCRTPMHHTNLRVSKCEASSAVKTKESETCKRAS